jgi:hypothetical protein
MVFRDGTAEDWKSQVPPRAERSDEVTDRLTGLLGLDKHTLEMRAVGIAEADRQQALQSELVSRNATAEREAEYRSRMGATAIGLVDALRPEAGAEERDVMIDRVLDALRPLDARLVRAEWDGVIR